MIHLAEIRVPEAQNNSKNNSTNFTRGHMGQIPVIGCFVKKNLGQIFIRTAQYAQLSVTLN